MNFIHIAMPRITYRTLHMQALEYYTSAILQFDGNPVLFTNRAQTHIKLEQFDDAVADCQKAIRLKPDSVKAQIHLARALSGRGEFQVGPKT